MTAAPPADAARRDRLIGALLVALGTVLFALAAGTAFRPPPGVVSDFTQDWLSARDALAGRPAYGDLPDSFRRHLGAEPPDDFLLWNAHPPGAVVLAFPFALLDHEDAFFAWNLVTFPLFVLAVWIAAAELGPWAGWRAAGVAAMVAALGAWCAPLYTQVQFGQFNALLAFLVTVAWAADRHGRWRLAGLAAGAAAAVKLFPALLLVYFVAARRWRAAGATALTGAALAGATVAVLGPGALVTYAREVVPSVSARYASQWNNVTLSAFWLRVFDPAPDSHFVPVTASPLLAKGLATLTRFAVVPVVAVAVWRSRGTAGRDRAFALAVVAMVLVSPIAWPHYLVMLVVPIGLLLATLSGRWRLPLFACLVLMWLPDTFVPTLAFGREFTAQLAFHRHDSLSPAGNLLVASVPFYAVLGPFLLLACRGAQER